MSDENLINLTADHIRTLQTSSEGSHDWQHTERVWKMSRVIAESEGANTEVVELAALLHDIADHKYHNGDLTAGPKAAQKWLGSLGLDQAEIEHICAIISEVSFKGAGVADNPTTLEAQVVQDADRLDAIGAIGIARAFAYGGSRGRPLYEPKDTPENHQSFEAYHSSTSHTINHFYEKLLLLKDRMHTKTARKLAARRHKFMEQFLAEFYEEWKAEPEIDSRKFYVYILEMQNGNYYTGYTKDLKNRLDQHIRGLAKYTRAFKVKKMAACWRIESGQGDAMRLEVWVKKQPRARKQEFIKNKKKLITALEKTDLNCLKIFPEKVVKNSKKGK